MMEVMDDQLARDSRRLTRTELLAVFAFWTLLALITAANHLADTREVGFTATPRVVPIALAFQQMYLWALLTPPIFWLAGRFSGERASVIQGVVLLLAIGI